MGSEFGQFIEWDYKRELDWFLLGYDKHRQMQAYVKELNHFYLEHPPLYEQDDSWKGFAWICCDDNRQNIVSLRRMSRAGAEVIAVVNFSPVARENYRLGVQIDGNYTEALNSDDERFGGSGVKNKAALPAEEVPIHGYDRSIVMTVPPLACVYLTVQPKKPGKRSLKSNKKTLHEDTRCSAAGMEE